MIRQSAIFLVKSYQNYVSKFTPKTCRYYPTCSEFALWQFRYNGFFRAFFAVFFRILRCNQLFKGGIDYPVVYKKFSPLFICEQNLNFNVIFWFIPYKKDKFYLVKNLEFQKEK